MLVFNVSHDTIYIVIPYTDWLVTNLWNNNSPCQIQKITYNDSTTKKDNTFDTILTTLNALTQLNPLEVFKHYRGLDWDKYNENTTDSLEDIKKRAMKNIDNIIGGIKQ